MVVQVSVYLIQRLGSLKGQSGRRGGHGQILGKTNMKVVIKQYKRLQTRMVVETNIRARTFKCLRGLGIDSKE
jgi:hypothetical protein